MLHSPELSFKYGPIDVHPPVQPVAPGHTINVSISITGALSSPVQVDVYVVAMTPNSVGSAPTFGPPPAGTLTPVTGNPISVQPGGSAQTFQVNAGALPAGVTFLPLVFIAIQRSPSPASQMSMGIGLTGISAPGSEDTELIGVDLKTAITIIKDAITATLRDELRIAFAEIEQAEENRKEQ